MVINKAFPAIFAVSAIFSASGVVYASGKAAVVPDRASAPVAAPASPAGVSTAPVSPATAGSVNSAATAPDEKPSIKLHIDDTAVRQLLTMAQSHDTDDAHIEAWLDLPANKHLLLIGSQENNLTRAQLKANALEVIKGTATATSQPGSAMGCVRVDPSDLYDAMLTGLEKSEQACIATITARDLEFAPPGTNVDETVYFHLGGDWDAINYQGNVYVNMRLWQEATQPSWDGLDMIVAHETMHTIQNQAYGNPQADDTAQKAWVTALSKIQREGTARLVEYDTDSGPYRPGTYGFFERAIDTESLRRFPNDILLLGELCDTCFPTFNSDRFEDEFANGMNLGGPYYDVGHAIALSIDSHLGRAALIATVTGGPKAFFNSYIDLCRMNKDLPPLPDRVVQAVAAMPAKV